MKIKICLLNVQSGTGFARGYWQQIFFIKSILPKSSKNIEKICRIINKEKIDVLLTTENDAGSLRTNFKDYIELMSRLTKLKYKSFFQTFDIFFANQGNAIHSSFKVIKRKKYPLFGLWEPRCLGEAVLRIGKKDVPFFITHLSLSKRKRNEQIEEIKKILKNRRRFILAGDFNTPNIRGLGNLNMIKTSTTFPSWSPVKRLDYIFTKDIKVINSYLLNAKKSDHLAIVLEADI